MNARMLKKVARGIIVRIFYHNGNCNAQKILYFHKNLQRVETSDDLAKR